MSALAVAAVWAGAGLIAAAVLPAVRLRRLGIVVPLAGGAAVLLAAVAASAPVPGSAPAASLELDRVAQGLIAAASVSLAATLLIAPRVEAAQMRTAGLAGAAAVVALAAGSAIIWAVALTGALCVIALLWIAAAPGRATFAAGRVGIPGAAALLAAAPFLPIATVLTGPRPVLVSALLGCGLAALAGLLPLGGWAMGALPALPAADFALWALLLAPAALLSTQHLLAVLPPLGLVYFEGILTVLGLGTALWQALQALRLAGRARYGRIFLADTALAAVGIGTGHAAQSLPALLLLVLAHLTAAPILLQGADARPRAHRVSWLLLCGVPPAPSFWGRLLVIEALTQANLWATVAALIVMGMSFLAAILAALRPEAEAPSDRGRRLHAGAVDVTGWMLVAAGFAVGLAPGAAVNAVFGVR